MAECSIWTHVVNKDAKETKVRPGEKITDQKKSEFRKKKNSAPKIWAFKMLPRRNDVLDGVISLNIKSDIFAGIELLKNFGIHLYFNS